MTTILINTAIGMMICGFVLVAPHFDRRNGLSIGIACLLLAGINLGVFAWLAWTEINRKAEAAPINYQVAMEASK